MSNYWDDRFLKLDEEVFRDSEKYVKKIRGIYDREIDNLNKEIYNHLTKLQDEAGDISLADARKLLNNDELDLFKMNLEDFTKKAKGVITPEVERELNIVSRRVRISRLQAMQLEIKKTVANLMSREEKGLFAHLGKTYEYKFYKEMYGLQRIVGYEKIQKVNTNVLKDIINSPWASDGSNFSKRIWGRGDKLVNLLETNLSRDIARGASPDESIKNIAKIMNTSKANAGRLVMTESAAMNSRATKDSYNAMGLEMYQILATLDTRTSDVCQGMDDKIFELKDYKLGVTAPPFHPNCRTTTVPYFDDEIQRRLDGNRMARNPVTGKSVRVEDLSYDEWYKKYVKGSGKGYNVNTETKTTEKPPTKEKVETPKSLQKFEEYSKSWAENVVNKELSNEEIETISTGLKNLIDENEYAIRIDSDLLEKVLDDGKFKNQFETSTSGGIVNEKYRKKATKQLFGNSRLKPKEYEKYGYLGHKDFIEDLHESTTSQYGNVIVRFNKNKLKNNVTYTLDDSLGLAINDLTVAGDTIKPSANGINRNKLRTVHDVIAKNPSIGLTEFTEELSARYIELQYHGELSVDYIKEICFTGENPLPDEKVLQRLKDKNIDLYHMIGDWGDEKVIKVE